MCTASPVPQEHPHLGHPHQYHRYDGDGGACLSCLAASSNKSCSEAGRPLPHRRPRREGRAGLVDLLLQVEVTGWGTELGKGRKKQQGDDGCGRRGGSTGGGLGERQGE